MQLICPHCSFSIAVRPTRAYERPCPRCVQSGGFAILSRVEALAQPPQRPVAPAPRRAIAS